MDSHANNCNRGTGVRFRRYEDEAVSHCPADHRRNFDRYEVLRPTFVEEHVFFTIGRAMNENENFGDDLSPLCPGLPSLRISGR